MLGPAPRGNLQPGVNSPKPARVRRLVGLHDVPADRSGGESEQVIEEFEEFVVGPQRCLDLAEQVQVCRALPVQDSGRAHGVMIRR
jgi:hypothetical protein